MAFYNRLKTMKSAPVGTIMPWSGQSSSGNNPENIFTQGEKETARMNTT